MDLLINLCFRKPNPEIQHHFGAKNEFILFISLYKQSERMKIISSLILGVMLCASTVMAQDTTVTRIEKIYKSVAGHDLKAYIFYSPSVHKKHDNASIAFFHGGGCLKIR